MHPRMGARNQDEDIAMHTAAIHTLGMHTVATGNGSPGSHESSAVAHVKRHGRAEPPGANPMSTAAMHSLEMHTVARGEGSPRSPVSSAVAHVKRHAERQGASPMSTAA